MFRNKKQELNIGTDFHVIIAVDEMNEKKILIDALKLDGKEVEEIPEGYTKEIVKLDDLEISILYDSSKNEEELKNNLIKEKEKLLKSIERREKLLSNENYLNKAPSNIVLL